jgi:hypothetical protein
MMMMADTARELCVQDRGDGRDPLVSVEILEDPWTPPWEVARIALAVRRREEGLARPE